VLLNQEADVMVFEKLKLSSRVKATDAKVRSADAARDARDWLRACQLYKQIAIEARSPSPYWVQAGNCLKEAGDLRSAYACYLQALPSTAADPDFALQLGHLFKVTGNFLAARAAFNRAAKLGDPRAPEEVRNIEGVSEKVVRFAAIEEGDGELIPRSVFQALSAVLIQGAGSRASLLRLSRTLSAYGDSEGSDAFLALASVVDADSFLHGKPPLASAGSLGVGGFSNEIINARAQLEELVRFAAVNSQRAQPLGGASWPLEWPPLELDDSAEQELRNGIFDALRRIQAARESGGAGGASNMIAAMVDLAACIRPVESVVAFIERRRQMDLRRYATLLLNAGTAAWLKASGFVDGGRISPTLGYMLANCVNPVRLRLSQHSAVNVFHEIDYLLATHLSDRYCEEADDVMADVLSASFVNNPERLTSEFLDPALSEARPKTVQTLLGLVDRAERPDLSLRFSRLLKEGGEHQAAFELLMQRVEAGEEDTDLLAETAIVAKIAGHFQVAAQLFERLYRNAPSEFLCRELVAVLPEVESVESVLKRFRNDSTFVSIARERWHYRSVMGEVEDEGGAVADRLRMEHLSPELALECRVSDRHVREFREEISIQDMGWKARDVGGRWIRELRPCDFVRVRTASRVEIAALRVRIMGRTIARTVGTRLMQGYEESPFIHTQLNCWLDLAAFSPGYYEVELYFEERQGGYRVHNELIYIGERAEAPQTSLSSVDLRGGAEGSVDERIRALPSEVFKARRHIFDGDLRRILLVRADQLGDTTQSIGAMFSLKEAFPDAQFDCLTSPGARQLMVSTGLFNEVDCVDHTYEPVEQRRAVSIREQKRLRRIFGSREYDLAVDLSPGFETQYLLKLVNARHTAGFKPSRFRFLTFGAEVITHDPVNAREIVPHSAMIESFVASLIAMAKHRPFVRRIKDPDWQGLEKIFGIRPGERYVVLHSGARLAIKRWPFDKYVELARLLVAEGLKTVLLADDGGSFDTSSMEQMDPALFSFSAQQIDFSTFDTLLGQCAAFVGNDTGPKHLAAYRGAPVVSVHMGQVNWNEWGQDAGGYVVARRAPCVGCGIGLPEQCGKGLACLVDIKPEEICSVVLRILNPQPEATVQEPMQ